jgi:glycosyltransferase 2 family protein
LAFVLSISIVVHFGLTGAMCLISNALYTNPPTVAQHFIVIPPAVVAGALPLTPGGLGVQEGAIDQLFREMPGVDKQFSGLVIAAMYRLMTFCVAGIGAVYYFTGIGQSSVKPNPNQNTGDQKTAP